MEFGGHPVVGHRELAGEPGGRPHNKPASTAYKINV